MRITLDRKSTVDLHQVHWNLSNAIAASRFTANIEVKSARCLEVKMIRLREAKPYCGNHPAECENNFTKPRRGKYLEGTDWVSFNDLLNDVLDSMNVEANVNSAVCNIRQGRNRRVGYGYHMEGVFRTFAVWDRVGEPQDYEDWCGKENAPDSCYPIGTPGIYTRDFYGRREQASAVVM